MTDQKTQHASGASRLSVKLAAFLAVIIYRIVDPLILWCYGWKHHKYWYARCDWDVWTDPKNGEQYGQSLAIKICEQRIKGG
jgi:ABC-type Zn uptake system ZnuABC Zn-binding protein ZnuA